MKFYSVVIALLIVVIGVLYIYLTGKKPSETKQTELPSTELLPVCNRFYDEVCMSGFDSPHAMLNEEGYYVLDMASYKDSLRKTGLFTDGFIAMQDRVFEECLNALEKQRLTPESAEEGIEMNAPLLCGFFHYAYYFQSQEYPDNFQLKNTSIKGNTATTEIHFYTADRDWDQLVYLAVTLKKENGSWYIDQVEKQLNN